MGISSAEVLERLPQKPPFLFVDECLERTDSTIKTTYMVTGSEDFFAGHFPDNPIMPGVLLQEAAFQSGALLMTYLKPDAELGVVSRVQDVKFKNFVKPGDLLEIEVTLEEQLENAFYMKAKMRVAGKLVMAVSFTGTSL